VTYPVVVIDYTKCQPNKCSHGICAASAECPNKVLRQEAAYEFPFSHPSRFRRGCAKWGQACPSKAITRWKQQAKTVDKGSSFAVLYD